MSRIMGGASRIIQGIQHFQERVFGDKKSLFRRLGEGQFPLALFITCCDSRIDPNLLTQTDPGQLFIHRNIGNLVPPHGVSSSIVATLEYALKQLHIREIIVCGHSKCGAMQGLLAPEALQDMPGVADWLRHARAILPGVEQASLGLSPAEKLDLTIERNVLLQIEHVKSHPCVAEALSAGRLRLHAWVYHIASGQMTVHDPGKERFVPLAQVLEQEKLRSVTPGSGEHGILGDSI